MTATITLPRAGRPPKVALNTTPAGNYKSAEVIVMGTLVTVPLTRKGTVSPSFQAAGIRESYADALVRRFLAAETA